MADNVPPPPPPDPEILAIAKYLQAEKEKEQKADDERLAKFNTSQPSLGEDLKSAGKTAAGFIPTAIDTVTGPVGSGLMRDAAVGAGKFVGNVVGNNLATARDLEEANIKTGDPNLDAQIAAGAHGRISDRGLTVGQQVEKSLVEGAPPAGPVFDRLGQAQAQFESARNALGASPTEENQAAYREAELNLKKAKAQALLDGMSPEERAKLTKEPVKLIKHQDGAGPGSRGGPSGVMPGGGGFGGGGGGGGGGVPGAPGMPAAPELTPEEQMLRQRQAEVALAYDDQYQAQKKAAAEIDARAAADADNAAQRQKLLQDYQGVFNQAAAQVAEAPEFSRDHFWASKSTGDKIATVIGTMLQGIGFGIMGKPELAAGLIDREIDKDLMVQKMNFQKRQGGFDAVQGAYAQAMKLASNADEADKVARAGMYDRIAKDIEAQATKIKGANQSAEYEMMLARLAEKREEALLKAQTAMMKRRGGRGGGMGEGGGGGQRAAAPGVAGFTDPEKVVYVKGKYGVSFNDKSARDKFAETMKYAAESRDAIKEMIRITEGVQNGTIPKWDASTREAFNRAKMAAMPPTSQGAGSGVINGHDETFMKARLGGVDYKDVVLPTIGLPGASMFVNSNALGQLKDALKHTDTIIRNQAEANGGAVVVNTGETYDVPVGGRHGAKISVAAPRIMSGATVGDLFDRLDSAQAGPQQPQQKFDVNTKPVGE